MSPDERREHILEITDALGAIVIVDRELVCDFVLCDGTNDPQGMAQGRKRPWNGGPILPPQVYLSHDPGGSAEAYIVALHELGHIVKGPRGSRREHEEFAWRWAVKTSREDVTPDIWKRIARDMRTYVDLCRRCKPSPAFDRLLRQAERRAA